MKMNDRKIIPMRVEKCQSTNDELKKILINKPTWCDIFPLLYSDQQTSGRGRGPGRSWWSPKKAGLYMSIVLPVPDFSPDLITTAIGAKVVHILRQYTKLEIQQVGINDIFLDNRKLGGILCEIYKERLIVGIGINLFKPVKIRKDLVGKAVWLNEFSCIPLVDRWEIMKLIAGELIK
jgi:BirA family transcriptional regulator, biotin operon repressor / biotin---[acetyl-CoA-carboxylase] ligase